MGKNWASAIGINQYDNLQALDYAKGDAGSVRDFFIQEAGFEQVYFFTEDSPPIQGSEGPPIRSLPTYATLKRFLRVRFEQPFLRTGDNFWFFFAGHGTQHEGRDYLMPLDADPGSIDDTAIPVSFITERLQRCGADNVILLLDACRSWQSRDGQGVGTELQKGVITLFSCSPRERSYEIEELKQGSFTYSLLEGLRLQGASNCATVERLDHYLYHRVPELNRNYGKPPQTPRTTIEPITKNHLILLPQQTTLLADVKELKLDAYKAERRKDWFTAQQFWTRVLAVSPADQEAIDGLIHMGRSSGESTPVATPVATLVPSPSRESSKTLPTFSFEVVTVNAQGKITNRQQKQVRNLIEDLGNGVSLDMVEIPGGRFLMGSPKNEPDRRENEGPQHEVTVPAFLMGRYPITQAQWRAIVTQVPKIQRDLEPDPSRFKGDNRPVERVSWLDAVEFCARPTRETGRIYRLPSEAEWEYACRAGTTTPFHFGETITPEVVNYDGNRTYGSGPKGKYREETTPVGSFKVANGFGLCDMHGNVWEWCADPWHSSYDGAPNDGNVWDENNNDNRYQVYSDENLVNLLNDNRSRIRRGGSWDGTPRNCRSAYRSNYNPVYVSNSLGFRVVRILPRALQ
ncbi:MAG: SUMF1/EgtB/PvdO family nonheme iron enzyme [Microcoleaceae cyanobacterium]